MRSDRCCGRWTGSPGLTGLVMLMVLVRLRTAAITGRYVNIIGHDYVERGLPNFFEDFRNSMYVYTPDFLSRTVAMAKRSWVHATQWAS